MISIWPSFIWLSLTILGFGLQWGGGTLKATHIVALVMVTGILYWGGFFDPLLRLASN